MSRSSNFFPLVAFLGLAACGVGEFGTSNNMTTDASIPPDRNLCATKTAPGAPHMHAASGEVPAGARAGMACMDAGCHIAGSTTTTPFAFAGTVYKDTAGTTAQGGVVVRVFNTNGDTMRSIAQAITDSAGNFVIRPAAGMYAAFPYATDVTACGNDAVAMGIRPMVKALSAKNEGNCNLGGACHVIPNVGGTPNPIYLKD